MLTLRRRLALAVILALGAGELRAQCPDGSPPPCRGARRAGPTLNEREWIVVPFGNVAHAQDMDWLRDASVNLLTLEVGRWTDVQVVNDKRVGDLVRELPAATRGEALTLNDGLSLARRAGAGKLVMGDFIKQGRGTRLVANVFDVRSGNRVRTVQQQATEPDSLLSAFGPLARGVLDVPPPPDARTGDLGTSSLDAYQAYLLGVRALSRFQLDDAETQLRRALSFDSTFALAHLQLAVVLGWGAADAAVQESRAHALAAQRFGARLPPRERALIDAEVGLASNDFVRACRAATPLVTRDSTDIQALYMLGECSYHDNAVIPGPNDTLPGRFRGDWNTALWALGRVLQLDPSYHQAFEHILDILRSPARSGCAVRTQATPCEEWIAALLRDGDTLLMQPESQEHNWRAYAHQLDLSFQDRPAITNLARARTIAETWVAADPASEHAHYALASVLMREGNLAAADSQLRMVNSRAYDANYPALRARLEVAAKLGRGAEARAWFDSLVKAIPDAPGNAVMRGSIDMLFGRLGRSTMGLTNNAQRLGPEAVAYARHAPRVLLGLRDPEAGSAEVAWAAAMRDTTTCKWECRLDRLMPTLAYGMLSPRTAWPALPDSLPDYRFGFAQALARHDTAALREAARVFDRDARHNVEMGWMENGWMVLAADGYLALGDSAKALQAARFYVDSAMASVPMTQAPAFGYGGSPPLWVRMMRLRADLAAAAGNRDEARIWYDRVLDLWAQADAEFQPEVSRIRAARAALR